METICPNPKCAHRFSLEEPQFDSDKRNHFHGLCPNCKIQASFRTLEALAVIDNVYEKRKARGGLAGGPELQGVPRLSVLVEDVRSLWNVGSIFRTADGAGFDRIYLSGISGSPPRKEIEKVSLGAENTVNWLYERNPLAVIEDLKSEGVEIVGLEVSDNSRLLTEALAEKSLSVPLCLVLGNEVSGLSPQVLSSCSSVCHLPMRGFKESLNVAVAFGIAAYALAEALS